MSSSVVKQGILILLMATGICATAQQRALGSWKMHLPYSASYGVWDAGDRVYSAAPQSVFSYDKATGAIQIYDKSNGLSDVGVKTIAYDPASKYLVIAYNNSNIDLIYNGTDIYNISDIKTENITGSVGINGLSFYNGRCYVATDMGISVINLAKQEISNTYIIGNGGATIKVYGAASDGISIYAATQEGVKHASYSASNLQDFNSWSLYNSASGIPAKPATFIAAYNNKAYAVIRGEGAADDTLYVFSGNSWQVLYSGTNDNFVALNSTGNGLYFAIWNSVGGDHPKKGKIDNSGFLNVQSSTHYRAMGWFEDNGTSWEADLWGGMYKHAPSGVEGIKPAGPNTANVFRLNVTDGTLNVASGSTDDSWGYTFTYDGFFIYKNNTWFYRGPSTDNVLREYGDILAVAANPAKGKTYFGSYMAGLIEYDNNYGTINAYDTTNSPLERAEGDINRTKISALTVDKSNNLWISNTAASKPLKVLRADGSWKGYTLPLINFVMKRMLIDQNGQLWAPFRATNSDNGLMVWSNNGTWDNESDDKVKILRSGAGNGNLPDAIVHSVVEDKDGNIWVGTNQGIATFYCPGSVLGNGCDADLIKVERDGYIGYLFSTESIRALAVDAGNRKWVGTTNGLWLLSADGKTELLEFNVDNSPLPSNQITDIAIDEITGEVYIGTTAGLVSYQGDAVGECADCESALVYPNPVKPEYEGPIAIKGLTENAYVKITDISGKLIYQGKANGSQMVWDGKGYNGTRAKSGVYLVFSSTDLGKEKRVAKILIAN